MRGLVVGGVSSLLTGHAQHEARGQQRPKAAGPTDRGWKSLKLRGQNEHFLLST